MANSYDVIVIGGGHNGLVNAAYLARAGKKVLVLERRHVLGGAACTEEIVPGFKFSVCSYVVSLLRPEIIRDLDLPRHGLEILPLDGTFTPMPSGDYLWRVNDHGKTHRAIARHPSVDPRLTFNKFIEAEHLPADFLEDINRFKYRGSSGKVNMALDGLPNFKCMPGPGAHLRGAMSISPSVEYMERAYDDAKYGN